MTTTHDDDGAAGVLRVEREIFERFPGVHVGVIVAHEIDNGGERPDLSTQLRYQEERLRDRLAGEVLVEHPSIAPWRDAYRAFGAKPKKYPSSIEALVRRVLKGDEIPSINPLVDLYNVSSLRHLLPVGGEDLDRIEGRLELRFATANEPEVELLGRPVAAAPEAGEVIYADDVGAVCRRWNWREAARTCMTAETRNAVLVVEALPSPGEAPVRPTVEAVLAELTVAVSENCGGRCESSVRDRSQASEG